MPLGSRKAWAAGRGRKERPGARHGTLLLTSATGEPPGVFRLSSLALGTALGASWGGQSRAGTGGPMPADRMLVRGACAESPVLQNELFAFIQRQFFATLRNEVFFLLITPGHLWPKLYICDSSEWNGFGVWRRELRSAGTRKFR